MFINQIQYLSTFKLVKYNIKLMKSESTAVMINCQ